MSKVEQFAETVHKVEIPTHHCSLLVAEDGRFLRCSESTGLGLTDQGDDSILWDIDKSKNEFTHMATGERIECSRLENEEKRVKLENYHARSEPPADLEGCTEFLVEHGPAEKPSESLEKLRSNGWVCLTKILSDEVVLELERTACTDRFEHLSSDRTKPALSQNPAVAITAAEPISLWVMRQYMQIYDIKLGHAPAFAVLRPDDGKRNVQGWHSDFPYHWGTGAKGQVPPSSGHSILGVQRNVCVSDFSKVRGATAFKLGSHVNDSGPPEDWGTAQTHGHPGYREQNGLPYNGPDADIIEAPGGSIILYDSRTWHRAGVNRTKHPRAAMLQAMIPMYILQKNDTSHTYKNFLESDIYDGLNSRVKQEVKNLMVHQFIGPGGRYVIAPDEELSAIVRDTSAAY